MSQRLLQILLRVGAERGERLRPLDARHRRKDLGHHARDLVVSATRARSRRDPSRPRPNTPRSRPRRRRSMFAAVGMSVGSTRIRTMVVITIDGAGQGGTLSSHSPEIWLLSSTSSKHVAREPDRCARRAACRDGSESCAAPRSASANDGCRPSPSTRCSAATDAPERRRARPRCASAAMSAESCRTSGHTAISTPLIRPAAHVENEPRAVGPLEPDRPRHAHRSDVARRQLRRENVGVGIPLVRDLGRRARRPAELNGNLHDNLSSVESSGNLHRTWRRPVPMSTRRRSRDAACCCELRSRPAHCRSTTPRHRSARSAPVRLRR